MLSQSSRWVGGGVGEEMGVPKIRDCGRACPPTLCWHPRGSCHGAEPVMSPELLGLARHQNALSQPEGARALLSGHQHIPASLCRGRDGASVSRHGGGAPICSLLSIELGNAAVCQAVTRCDFTDNSGHLSAQSCQTGIGPYGPNMMNLWILEHCVVIFCILWGWKKPNTP